MGFNDTLHIPPGFLTFIYLQSSLFLDYIWQIRNQSRVGQTDTSRQTQVEAEPLEAMKEIERRHKFYPNAWESKKKKKTPHSSPT